MCMCACMCVLKIPFLFNKGIAFTASLSAICSACLCHYMFAKWSLKKYRTIKIFDQYITENRVIKQWHSWESESCTLWNVHINNFLYDTYLKADIIPSFKACITYYNYAFINKPSGCAIISLISSYKKEVILFYL